jgi:hypothetical protein
MEAAALEAEARAREAEARAEEATARARAAEAEVLRRQAEVQERERERERRRHLWCQTPRGRVVFPPGTVQRCCAVVHAPNPCFPEPCRHRY